MIKSYYEILGLRASASQDEIKRAYRKKAMEVHPDVNPTSDAKDAFLKINEAYAILSDAQKRLLYNQRLRDQAAQAHGSAYAQNTQASRDEAHRQWTQQARAQAAAAANSNYQDFKRTKFGKAEASVFFYLQFLVLGIFFLLGSLMILAPFAAMFTINWKAIFLVLISGPLSFKVFEQGMNGLRQLRNSQ
jgi:hypothetical protein